MFEINKKAFGAFIAQLRKEKGYTQKELAERLYISDKAVSKWETGASIPDTPLLIPLAELLEVSVTELLMGSRLEQDAPMAPDQVEDIVKTAIACSDRHPPRPYQAKNKWAVIYMISLLFSLAGLLLNLRFGCTSGTLLTAVLLSGIFGAYFCFFVRTSLPSYYDQNPCGYFHDGPFRMNIPGVSFNNANWPHIVRTGRIWACLTMVLYPLLSLLLFFAMPVLWPKAETAVFLLLILGGLFVPLYAVGKKHQ